MSEDTTGYKISFLRGGAIGLISGIKGGGLAGALGGALLMGVGAAAGEAASVIAFTSVVGLTTGLMAGAMAGALLGLLLGAVSGWVWPLRSPRPLIALWTAGLGTAALLLAGLMTDAAGPPALLLGAICGLLGGWWSGRDFVRVAGEQEGVRS